MLIQVFCIIQLIILQYFFFFFRLALYVYEYLIYCGAQKAAQIFLQEVSFVLLYCENSLIHIFHFPMSFMSCCIHSCMCLFFAFEVKFRSIHVSITKHMSWNFCACFFDFFMPIVEILIAFPPVFHLNNVGLRS